MALDVCIEPSVRIFSHLFSFAISHWLLLLIIIVFFGKLRLMTIGILGFINNFIGILDGPLPFIDIFTMFLQSIIWMFIILNAPINLIIRIILIPTFLLAGFLWDAMGGLPHLAFLNFIPLTLLVAYSMNIRHLNYIIIALPAILTVWLFLGISTPLCASVNEVLILLDTPCKSFLANIPFIGWVFKFILGC